MVSNGSNRCGEQFFMTIFRLPFVLGFKGLVTGWSRTFITSFYY